MRDSEYRAVVAYVEACWPHVGWPKASRAVYGEQLRSLDVGLVLEALKAFTLEREFPPTAGMILAKVLERHAPPDWDEVAAEVRSVIPTLDRVYSPATGSWPTLPPADRWSHPLVDEYLRTRVGPREFERCWGDAAFRAQARDLWNLMAKRERRRLAARVTTGLPPAAAPELPR